MTEWSIVPVDKNNIGQVPALFRKVYDDEYLHKKVYQPDILWQQIQTGNLAAVLAYSPSGLPIGYVALGRLHSNPRLWEEQGLIVDPAHKDSGVAVPLAEYFTKRENHRNIEIDGIFSYAVCYHYFTQIICAKAGWNDCFLLLDYINKSLYTRQPAADRVACVMMYSEFIEQTNVSYLPRCYEEFIRQISQPLYPRDFQLGKALLPNNQTTIWEEVGHLPTGSRQIAVQTLGSDWSEVAGNILEHAKQHKLISLQVILNMACPCIDTAVTILRQQGFFLGGLAPRWFGSDGIVMQRILDKEPDYNTIKLYTKTGKNLLAAIQADQQTVQQQSFL
ncbi:MAG: hypothetical protein H6Q72_1969 [Firmicutes bacterium]|nr:hypothetical protein [Bacillota bacterium]